MSVRMLSTSGSYNFDIKPTCVAVRLPSLSEFRKKFKAEDVQDILNLLLECYYYDPQMTVIDICGQMSYEGIRGFVNEDEAWTFYVEHLKNLSDEIKYVFRYIIGYCPDSGYEVLGHMPMEYDNEIVIGFGTTRAGASSRSSRPSSGV